MQLRRNSSPKVTIITVCFNSRTDLKITLQSVLEQTSSIFEYVVVDGGSTDGTFDLLMEYSSKFQELGIPFRFVSEHDKGTYDAMNKGASLAKGEWVNYMNAGDSFYSRSTLEDFFSNSILSQCGVIYGDTFQIYDFGSGVAKKCDYEKDNKVMPFCHQSCFVKAELMRQYKFNTSYKIVADYDLFFRLRKHNIVFQYVEVIVARYNGQYGLSATHPLTLRLEGLRVNGINERWYYPFCICWCYLRYGWVQPFKDYMPKFVINLWMKNKRKYIK